MRGRLQFSEEKSKKSELAKLNQQWFCALLSRSAEDPTANLLEALEPLWYGRQRKKSLPKTDEPAKVTKQRMVKKRKRPPFYASIVKNKATSYEVIEPLSGEVTDMLQPNEPIDNRNMSTEPLIRLIRESRCIAKMGLGDNFVARLNDRIAMKVTGCGQLNHCLALQYLAKHAPELPIPKSHGLIKYGGCSILFMLYIPGSTLTKVRPTLSDHQKAALQSQLNEIFVKVRQNKRKSMGQPLGMLDGEGVVDLRSLHDEFEASKPLYTIAEFEDFIFSYRPWVKDTYVQFLKTLLPASRFEEECVFTHCDVRNDNIMVDINSDTGECHVSGIIDWEEAEFYPAYWEAAKSTRCFLANQENDYYLMQPPCIAPSTYPVAWLVDRLWEEMIQYLGSLDNWGKRRTTRWKREWKNDETSEDED